jgi:hypothetical protein
MTAIEILLLLAVVVLAAQVLLLQRYYTEKLSDQAMVLNFLLNVIGEKTVDTQRLELIKDKIFSSSQ